MRVSAPTIGSCNSSFHPASQTVETVLAKHYDAVRAIQQLLQVPEEENVERAEPIEQKDVELEGHSVRKGVMLTATAVHLDAAVPVLDPDPSKDPDMTNHQRSGPVSFFKAATAQIADDQLRSYLPPTAELELAHRHQRNLSAPSVGGSHKSPWYCHIGYRCP